MSKFFAKASELSESESSESSEEEKQTQQHAQVVGKKTVVPAKKK